MGGGRITRESVLNLDVGVEILGKPGSRIEKGAPLLRIHARSTSDATAAARRLKTAITISKRAVRVKPLLEGSTS
jgi:thymidine phosphorylase